MRMQMRLTTSDFVRGIGAVRVVVAAAANRDAGAVIAGEVSLRFARLRRFSEIGIRAVAWRCGVEVSKSYELC